MVVVPPAVSVIYLVRHAQASLGASDYDELSPRGHRQAAMVGDALSRRDNPRLVVSGDLRRHRQTVGHLGLGPGLVDPRWNEFDHEPILAAAPATVSAGAASDPLEGWRDAKQRWAGGLHDDDYPESYGAFVGRARAAFDDVSRELSTGECAVVVTSAGVIAALAAGWLLGAGCDWSRVQNVMINTGITKVIVGAKGATLVSLNDHAHLSPDNITYL